MRSKFRRVQQIPCDFSGRHRPDDGVFLANSIVRARAAPTGRQTLRSTPRFRRAPTAGPARPEAGPNFPRSAPHQAHARRLSAPYLTFATCDARSRHGPTIAEHHTAAAPSRAGQSAPWVSAASTRMQHRAEFALLDGRAQRIRYRPRRASAPASRMARRSRSASGCWNSSSASSSACFSRSHG